MSTPWSKVVNLSTQPNLLQDFDCGDNQLTVWFQQHAQSQHHQRNITVWVCVDNEMQVYGAFALKTHIVTAPLNLSKTQLRKWGANEQGHCPAVLIAQLALASTYQRKSFGSKLLLEAESKCVELSTIATCKLIVVDAKTTDLIPFYTKQNYIPVSDTRLIKIMPTSV